MVTQDLIFYIRQQRDNNVPELQIKRTLEMYGWKSSDIKKAFNTFKPKNNNKILIFNIVNLLLIICLIFVNFYLFTEIKNIKNTIDQQNLAKTSQTYVSLPTPTTASLLFTTVSQSEATPTPTPKAATPIPIHLNKTSYSVAVYGDSMVDTMGENLEYLQKSLKAKYPTTSFNLYNYGIGSQTVQIGLERFGNSFNYKTRNYPPITEIKPDVIVIATFAYNPYFPLDLETYKSNLSQLLNKSRAVTPNTYLLVEIAPLSYDFGKGAGGVPDWSDQQRYDHAYAIVRQLKAAMEVAKQMDIKIINVYDKTDVNGEFGSYNYTETYSSIHPSVAGHTLTANTITQIIKLD